MERILLLAVLVCLAGVCQPQKARRTNLYKTRFGVDVLSRCNIQDEGWDFFFSDNHYYMANSEPGILELDIYPPPIGYNMSKPVIELYTFHHPYKFGRVRLQFLQFDLNPKSLIYIYDGVNSSSPGSVWTHKSKSPVYVTTGPSLYMVFKNGKTATRNKHMGFTARVMYTRSTEWNDMPSTGVCAPFRKGPHGWWTVIRSINLPKGVPVFCPYTSHLTDQKYIYTLNEEGSDDMTTLHDYPTDVCSIRVRSYKSGIYDQYLRRYHFNIYNISTAKYGHYLLLEPNFTSSHQVVVVATGRTEAAAQHLAISVLNSKSDTDYHSCPYKTCARSKAKSPVCTDYWKPCSKNKRVDATCDYISKSSHNPYDRCWDKTGHCFNTQLDSCDGLADCDAKLGKDERVGCENITIISYDKPRDQHCDTFLQKYDYDDPDDGFPVLSTLTTMVCVFLYLRSYLYR